MSLLINIVDSSGAVIADGVWVAAQRSSVEFGGTSTANATWVFLALILGMEYFTLNLNLFCWLEKKEFKNYFLRSIFFIVKKGEDTAKLQKKKLWGQKFLGSF